VRRILIVCLLATLVGCVRWNKPGADHADFDHDKAMCIAQSYRDAPVANSNVALGSGYNQPAYTRCNGSGNTMNCTTTGGSYVPPPTISTDQNVGARNAAFRACMYEAGWSEQRRGASDEGADEGSDDPCLSYDSEVFARCSKR